MSNPNVIDISSNPNLIGTTSTITTTTRPAVAVTEIPVATSTRTITVGNVAERTIGRTEVEVVQQEPQIATQNQLDQVKSTMIMWFVIIFIIILIAVIIGLIIYWASRPVKNNVTCVDQAGCSAGNYCNSSGICVPGSGATNGTLCGTNDDCRFGLACINGVCSTSGITEIIQPCTPISTPAKFRLKTVISGTTYYIVVSGTNSVLTTSQPNNSYTYDNSREILSLNDNLLPPTTVPIGVHAGSTNNGQMYAAAGAGHIMCLSGTLDAATLTLDCGSILEYAGTSSAPTNVYFPAVSTSETCKSFPTSTPSKRVTLIIEQV